MSPIDIVPVDQQPHYLDETVMDSGIIENKGVYASEEFSSREETLSSKALVNHIKPQPRAGRTVVCYIMMHYRNIEYSIYTCKISILALACMCINCVY